MKYLTMIKLFVQEELLNRSNLIINLLLSTLSISALLLLWDNLYQEKLYIGGISRNEMLRYYLGVLIIGKLIKPGADDYFKDLISSGKLSYKMIKPFGIIKLLFSRTVAKVTVSVSGLILASLVLSEVFQLGVVVSFSQLLLSIPSIILAFLLGFFVITTIGALHFYFEDLTYFTFLARDVLLGVFAGVMFNLELLSTTLKKIFSLMPFKYIVNFPVSAFTSDMTKSELTNGTVIQLFWTIICACICLFIVNKGFKKYSHYGG